VSGQRGFSGTSNGLGAVFRLLHETLMLDVPVPDAGKRLDVSYFGRSDEHLAILADEHTLGVAADVA
jgi:hypothetical protein